jgi:hypothetical protein
MIKMYNKKGEMLQNKKFIFLNKNVGKAFESYESYEDTGKGQEGPKYD